MISKTYRDMLQGKSVIRELSEYAQNVLIGGGVLRPEDVFDFSLGNPSVPVPDAFNRRVAELTQTGSCTDTARAWASPPCGRRSPHRSTAALA